MKVAVVTPYYQEPVEMLRRCHESVRSQTHACTHIMIADGHPRHEIEEWDIQHCVLPVSNRDYGNTPRGIGSILAFNQGFDAVAYLDADNWYAEDHLEILVAVCREYDVPVAVSSRQIVLSTGEYLPFGDPDEESGEHVDTNCFLITSEAAFLSSVWAMMDPAYSPVGDRVLLKTMQKFGILYGWSHKRTLFYESRWAAHFLQMGKEPPASAAPNAPDPGRNPYNPKLHLSRLGYDPFNSDANDPNGKRDPRDG
jgi:glycosyltransferase involved in cell wall biosynthesis